MKKFPFLIFVPVAGGIFLFDRLTKAWAIESLMGERPVEVCNLFLQFVYVENRGGAFGMFSTLAEPWRTLLLLVMPLLAVAVFLYYFWQHGAGSKWLSVSFSLILGGAFGNLADRLTLGYVVDFIDCHWFDKAHWPAFNVADSAVSVGATLMVLEYLYTGYKASKEKKAMSESAPGITDELSD